MSQLQPFKKKKTILWHWSRSYILAYCKCHEFSKLKYSDPKDAFSAHAQKDWMLENDYCTEDKNETKVNKLIWFKLDECKWLKLVDICCSKKKQTNMENHFLWEVSTRNCFCFYTTFNSLINDHLSELLLITFSNVSLSTWAPIKPGSNW